MEQKPGLNLKKVLVVVLFSLFCGAGIHVGPIPGETLFSDFLVQRPSKVEVFDPGHQREVSAESEDLVVSLARVEPCSGCSGGKSFTFEVRDKRRATRSSFTIRNDTAQADEIAIVSSSRAIVLGSVSGTTRIVNVVDLSTGSVVDFFYCHFPSVHGRFVAYLKFVPRYSTQPGWWSSVYLIYDATASPMQNRLHQRQGFEDRVDVGVPIYPPENVERGVYEPMIASEEDAHQLASDGLFWIEDGVLAFVDRWKGANHLVVVDVRSGIVRPKVQVRRIETVAVLDPARCEDAEHPEKLIHVEEISVPREKSGYVRLHFSPRDSCLRSATLDVPIR